VVDDAALNELATYSPTPDLARAVVARLAMWIGANQFYIFWSVKRDSAGGGAQRARTLLCFTTADAALTFAQRNGLAAARVRRLLLSQVLLIMTREPTIAALLFVHERDSDVPVGQLPTGLRLDRAQLLHQLQHDPDLP